MPLAPPPPPHKYDNNYITELICIDGLDPVQRV